MKQLTSVIDKQSVSILYYIPSNHMYNKVNYNDLCMHKFDHSNLERAHAATLSTFSAAFLLLHVGGTSSSCSSSEYTPRCEAIKTSANR